MPASTSPFGKYLRAQRRAERLSQRELAKALGLSNAFISQVERGARPPLAPEHWPALLAALPRTSVAELQRAAAQTRPLEIDLAKAPADQVEMVLAIALRIRAGDLSAEDTGALRDIATSAAAGAKPVRAYGRVVDAAGQPVVGQAFVYRLGKARGWSALIGARSHDGRVLGPLDARSATLVGKSIQLLSAKDPRGAGFFDVPGGLAPGDYALDVHGADGREAWAWPLTVTDGTAVQEVRLRAEASTGAPPSPPDGGDDTVPIPPPGPVPGPSLPASAPPVPPLARQFTKGTFTPAFSYYGLGGAPRDRIARDLDRFRAAGFGHARVWVDWERPSAASRIVDRKGGLIEEQADKLSFALDRAAALGLTFDLTLETSHYDAVKKSEEGYDITAHKAALKNVLARWGRHPAVRIVDVDNEAEVRGAGGHGSPDTGHTSPARFADLMSVARSLPRSCLVGASVSFSIDGLPKDYQNLFRDTQGEILLPHFPRVKGWGAAEGPNAKKLAAAFPSILIHHQEPGRNGHSTTPPGGWPLPEFENAFKSAKAAGSLGCCFHTGAAFDLTSKDAWDQLDPTERQVVERMAGWVK